MTAIKPIETVYKGYRFRSRLEARWAVFFDALEVEWLYEVEGYDLGPDGWYLPDFWFPNHGVWVEIKPRRQEYNHKCEGLVRLLEYPVVEIRGEPYPGKYDIAFYRYSIVLYELSGEDGFLFEDGLIFGLGKRDKRELWIGTAFDIADDDPFIPERGNAYCLNPITDDQRWPRASDRRLMKAYKAARSARFEHGERGVS